jgi:hypothetical protein
MAVIINYQFHLCHFRHNTLEFILTGTIPFGMIPIGMLCLMTLLSSVIDGALQIVGMQGSERLLALD